MTLDELKGDADPLIAELAGKVEEYGKMRAAGTISQAAHDELCLEVLDLKAICARAGREDTDQVLRAAVQALMKIAGVLL